MMPSAASVNVPHALFFYRNSDQTVDDMVDLDGQSYTKLPEAFRFRETYIAECTCHGNPWDAQAIARHEANPRNPPSASPTAAVDKPKLAEPRRRSRQSFWGYRGYHGDH